MKKWKWRFWNGIIWFVNWNLHWNIWNCSATGDWPFSKRNMSKKCSCCYIIFKVPAPSGQLWKGDVLEGLGKEDRAEKPNMNKQLLLIFVLVLHMSALLHVGIVDWALGAWNAVRLPVPSATRKNSHPFVVGLFFTYKCGISGFMVYSWKVSLSQGCSTFILKLLSLDIIKVIGSVRFLVIFLVIIFSWL